MADFDSQEISRLTEALDRLQTGMGGLRNGLRERNNAEAVLSRDLRARVEATSDALGSLSSSARNANQYFTRVLGGTALGAVFMKMVNVGNDMTNTYRELVNVGQNFEGSILNMSIAAGAAGLPLQDFAEAVKGSSKVVARMGMKDFVALNKSVNQSMIQHGMYAMTTQQITQHMGGYLETNRRMGMVERMTHKQVGDSFVKLMGHTSALSTASGVAREEIQQMAQSAIQSSMAMSRMATMSSSTALRVNQNFQESMAVLASHGSTAAQFLTGLHAEAFGQASAAFTDQGRALISVGLGHLGSMFEKEMTAEQTIVAQQKFREEIEANIPMLRNLAKGTGESASQARMLLAVQSDMQKMTVEDYRRAKKSAETQDGLTKLFTTFGAAWNLIVGSFKEGFLKGFKPLFASIGDFTKSDGFKTIERGAASLGARLGELIAWVLSPSVLQNIGDGLHAMGSFLFNLDWKAIGIGVAAFTGAIIAGSAVKWATLFGVIGTLTSWLSGLTEVIGPGAVAGIGATIAGVSFLGKTLGAFSAIKDLFSSSMVVNAASVIVNGAGGGMGGMGGGGGGNRARRAPRGSYEDGSRKGRTRQERISEVNKHRAAKGRPLVGGRMARAGGKSLLKKIPGIGILAGLGFGAQRALNGDFLGAGGEVLSGLAGTIPGIGTGASFAIDAALMARDGGAFGGAGGAGQGGAANPRNPNARGGRKWGRMAMMAGGVGAAGLLGYGAYQSLMGDEKAPKTNENDPVVRKLDELIKTNKDLNDTVVRTQQGIVAATNAQTTALKGLKPSSNS